MPSQTTAFGVWKAHLGNVVMVVGQLPRPEERAYLFSERGTRDGESGDVVVSNLVNRATVLLNYRLGDIARKLSRTCPCGRSLPLLSFPEGRNDEYLQLASGKVMHPQSVRTVFR